MESITLNDRHQVHDGIAKGVVELRTENGKLIFRKNNMITLSGRKFLFNKIVNSAAYEDANINKIFVGEDYGITYPEMKKENITPTRSYALQDANIHVSYNLIDNSQAQSTESLIYDLEEITNVPYINTISYKKISSLEFIPVTETTSNGTKEYPGKYATVYQYTQADAGNSNEGSEYYFDNTYHTFINVRSQNRCVVKNHTFLVIDGNYAFPDTNVGVENITNFMEYFDYALDDDLIENGVLISAESQALFRKYMAVPYVEGTTFKIVENQTRYYLVASLPAKEGFENGVDIVLTTTAIVSDEPFIKIVADFDGSEINGAITELGLLFNKPGEENEDELFSRVIFEAVPMVAGNKFQVTYYVYF